MRVGLFLCLGATEKRIKLHYIGVLTGQALTLTPTHSDNLKHIYIYIYIPFFLVPKDSKDAKLGQIGLDKSSLREHPLDIFGSDVPNMFHHSHKGEARACR